MAPSRLLRFTWQLREFGAYSKVPARSSSFRERFTYFLADSLFLGRPLKATSLRRTARWWTTAIAAGVGRDADVLALVELDLRHRVRLASR